MTPAEYRKKIDDFLDLPIHRAALKRYREEAPLLSPKQVRAIYLMSGDGAPAEPWEKVATYVGLSPFLMGAWLRNDDFVTMMNVHAPHVAGDIDAMTFEKREECQFALGELIRRDFRTIEERARMYQDDPNAPDFAKFGLMTKEFKSINKAVVEVWKSDTTLSADIRQNIRLQAELSGLLETDDEADINDVTKIVIEQISRKIE